jgi:hypothetical protein
MLIVRGDGNFDGGIFDVICLLRNVNTGHYHTCFAEEMPLPGPMEPNPTLIRLKSKMHHTQGAPDLVQGIKYLEKLASKIILPAENILREPIDWNGWGGDGTFVIFVPNWRLPGAQPLKISLGALPIAIDNLC